MVGHKGYFDVNGRPINGVMANKKSVWTVSTHPYKKAHFATYPKELIKPCILAGSRPGDIILDPFAGSGTTGAVALSLDRKAILCELNPKYEPLIRERITSEEAYYQYRLFGNSKSEDAR